MYTFTYNWERITRKIFDSFNECKKNKENTLKTYFLEWWIENDNNKHNPKFWEIIEI